MLLKGGMLPYSECCSTMNRCAPAASALMLLAVACSPVVPADDSSPREVIVQRVATLGSTDGQGAVQLRFSSACTEEASTYYYADFRRQNVAVFDSTGRFLRSIGRSGSGPEEFRQILHMTTVLDTVYVVDPANGRVSLISPQGVVARAQPFAVLPTIGQGLAVLLSGQIVVSKIAPDPRSGELSAIHFLDNNGVIRESRGRDGMIASDVPRSDRIGGRLLATASDGGFWAASRYRHRVEKWSATGELERVIDVESDWFPGLPDRPTDGRLDTGPDGPWIVDIVEGAEGLWIAVIVGQSGKADAREDPYRDTVIELIDPTTGSIVAATRLDAQVAHFPCAGRVASSFEDEGGFPHVQMWSVGLR